ncbi:hypothetical protein [Neobacillus massiliamazoniensis]|jgi:hypothetical protein|uniref:Uncharacterized protein n=1 Tax=Neobacillus massiliamazoniensis TaxID=1499688 RepID=A0A0U1NX79_9BACI|nr:hypothetical protein [Neobacillus massiliamazoniensis]CRK82623.1 hypothetical protein BN000_02556 [Neobacillus massiliamazoniensis]
MIWVIIPALALTIPIIAILTDHFGKQNKIKHEMIKDQLELEKLKQENYLIETEKMKLELEKIRLEAPNDKFM